MSTRAQTIRIGWLYGQEMNIYGDRGNVMALAQRASWRGYDVDVQTVGIGEDLQIQAFDMLFWGGGQDREQVSVSHDLAGEKAAEIRDAVQDGVPILAICGGYQFLGHEYRPFDGEPLPGTGAIDVWSQAGHERYIGNVLVETEEFGDLVGFENHSGRTFLGSGVRPLGRSLTGGGNNGEDGTEGVRAYNAVGCYLHGALLPKNPRLADWLVARAIERTGGDPELQPLDDQLEERAHRHVRDRVRALKR